MNYDDFYLLRLIRQNQNAIVALWSIVGYLRSQVITPSDFANLFSEGTTDPNASGLVPARPDLINIYWQKSGTGVPETLWVWLANSNKWQ